MRCLARAVRRVTRAAALLVVVVTGANAQAAPEIERPVAFDAAGRLTVITSATAARLGLSGPAWPAREAFREARLYMRPDGSHVLVVLRPDGTVARYSLDNTSLMALKQTLDTALLASAERGERAPADAAGSDISQPAGNAFVRNQALLGLTAYGPATSAILSETGAPAAVGGYFLAAGSAFFIAANTVKNRNVTRAQNLLASHGGVRGAIAGAGTSVIMDWSGGAGYGIPILAGAVGGTLGGFRGARDLSDGEAASSTLMADLSALTVLGVSGALGAFERERVVIDDEFGSIDERLRTSGKAAIGAAIGTGVLGYVLGPRYARHASYNVTAGDVTVAFTGAGIGALAGLSLSGGSTHAKTAFGVSTAGLLAGLVVSDRLLVRTGDRTAANGTLTQLGAVAGALMGGGVAIMVDGNRHLSTGLVTGGAALGLVAADRLLSPSPDAGPMRGIMQSSSLGERVQLSLTPLVTALAMQQANPAQRTPAFEGPHAAFTAPVVNHIPVLRIRW